MYTQCPHCDAIFQVSTAHLKAANGEVRCGQCLAVFNALNHLSDEIPSSIHELEQKALDDTTNDHPWADDKPAENDPAELPIDNIIVEPTADDFETATTTDEHVADASLEPEIVIEATIESPSKFSDSDIFSEVVAEASQHSLPTEEIERFEEFLSTNDSESVEAEAELSTEFIELANEFATDSVVNDNLADNEAVKLGDIETATADLDTESHIDTTDEFAEFGEYLPPSDELANDITSGPAIELSSESIDPIVGTADSEAIIIEEIDLTPVASDVYSDTDTPADWATDQVKEHTTETDDFSELEAAAAEISETNPAQPSPRTAKAESSSDGTFHIPALLMEDLHAAKAEQLRPSSIPWVIGSLVLMLTLVLQVAYFSRDELVKDAKLRPWLIQMCQLANCTLTQTYDIKQIDIIGREVRSHPSARKALIASTTLINNAGFAQPFPLLTVVFSNINGRPLAQRRFTPREYLNSTVDLAAGMTPNLPVRIELELVDPGKAAVNYEFHAVLDPRNTRPLT